MNISAAKRIAMLGIGGSGMRGLAAILAKPGITIIGIDRFPGPGIVPETEATSAVVSANLVIHTDAISDDHPLIKAALDAHIPTVSYQQALGEVTHSYRTLAVTGTHGKSSTTSLLAHIFVAAGLDPTALVGAPVPAWNNLNARIGQSEWFIVEADEYRNHFLTLTPESAIISAIDFDHPDFFASLSAVEKSFSEFIQRVSTDGIVVVPEALITTFPRIPWPATTQGIASPSEPIDLVLPGQHMQYNAWLAIQLAGHYGVAEAAARAAVASFPGLGRRFELLGRVAGMDVVSDYGHHPAEIKATLQAARERYGNGRIGVLFEAHTYDRLQQFFDDFVEAFQLADGVVLVPPFVPAGRATRQPDIPDLIPTLAERLKRAGVTVSTTDSFSTLSEIVTSLASDFVVTVAFSAGRLDGVLREFVK